MILKKELFACILKKFLNQLIFKQDNTKDMKKAINNVVKRDSVKKDLPDDGCI